MSDAHKMNAYQDRYYEVANVRKTRGEIIDLSKREVWQAVEPTPRDWWDSLSLEMPLAKAGIGSGCMDRASFSGPLSYQGPVASPFEGIECSAIR